MSAYYLRIEAVTLLDLVKIVIHFLIDMAIFLSKWKRFLNGNIIS